MSWQDYFDASADNDAWKAFDALAAVGVLPVVNGEDKHGKIKRPMAGKDEAWQKITTDEWRRRLKGYLQNGVPVGIGCKPVGHLVMDIDPKGKDKGNLADAWRETAQLFFGTDDPPKTLTIRTEAGCHVWFKVTDELAAKWDSSGKRKIKLSSGGAVELYLGIADGGYQVACAPSEGKQISIAVEPISLPKRALKTILDQTTYQDAGKDIKAIVEQAKTDDDLSWAKTALNGGHLDSELDDYESWLRVGMALSHRFGDEGALLWESWSSRNAKHVDRECFAKVKSFKRSGGNVATFGTLAAVVRRNGGPSPPKSEAFEADAMPEITPETEAANTADIRALMKEREWLWGDTNSNLGWFVTRGLHLVEGKEGTGKTRWLCDLVRRWSLDLHWPDGTKTTISPDAKILFVASDSHWDQIADTASAFGIPDENVIFTGPKDDPYNFTNLDDPATIAMMRYWCDRYNIAMIVVDTLMAASSRPLVDPQEVAKIAAPLRQLARDKGVPVVLVGHLNAQGETWGRAMGRTCDHVIRLESEAHDEQSITIKSVKARWNRFELPVIKARQGECGWEYSIPNSDAGDVHQISPGERAAEAILAYVRNNPKMTKSSIRDAMLEKGHAKPTIYRIITEMTNSGILVCVKEITYSGAEIPVYYARDDE